MADYYVSPSGSDTANGSITSPFLTVIKGLAAVNAGDRLILREGKYRGNAGWFAGKATAAGPITLEAYPEETPTLSALARISNWQPFDLTNGKAIYRATMPFTMCGTNSAIAGEDFVTCNGIPVNEAQWPAANPIHYPQKSGNWATVDSGAWVTSPSTKNALVTVQIQDTQLTEFPDNALIGSRITLLPGARWAFVSGTVSANTGDKLTFVIKSPGGESFYSPDSRSLYFLFGKSVFLTTPGSWWRDAETNLLYLWLPDSSNPNNSIIEAKKDSRILDCYARSHYKFKNLSFEGAGLNITNASNIRFDDCKFKWYSHRLYMDMIWGWINPALYVNRDQVEIHNCDFVDSFGTIIVPESQQGLIVKNSVLRNTGGITFAGINSKFIQNTINATPGGCFKLAGNVVGTDISYNDFGQSGNIFTDGGVFLVERRCSGNGRISRNFIHDGRAPSDGAKQFYGSAGIYFESDASNLIFDHNVICRTTSSGFNLIANHDSKFLKDIKFYNNTCDGSIYWIPTWAGNPTYLGVAFYNNYFDRQGPNTGYHPDLVFDKNAFKVLPTYLGSTNNIQTLNAGFDVNYNLASSSPLRSIAQPIAGITTDPFPDIGAREGIAWIPGAVVRDSDIRNLTVESYFVDNDYIVFTIGNLPLGRRIGENFKMKLGSGTEAVGLIVPYSKTVGRTVWARINDLNWRAIGSIAAPPVLQSLSSGAGLPGDVIEILGSDFQADTTVLLATGSELAAEYVSTTQLRITVPDLVDVGGGTLQFSVANPDGQISQSVSFSVLNTLSLTSLSANVVGPGQQIELVGTGFVAGAIAIFGLNTEVSTDFGSNLSLGVQIPILTPGVTTVKIVNPNAVESEALPLTIVVLPSISSFNPNPIRPGQELAVVGENFGADPYLFITEVPVIPIAFTETSIVAIVPANVPAGVVQFRIVSEVGSSNPVSITVERPPVLLSIVTPSAPIGTRVGLTGSDLIVGSQIFFGGTVGIDPIFSGTAASVIVPAVSPGIAGVKVVSAQGLESTEIDFEVRPLPVISSVLPTAAPVGDSISIVGENLVIGALVFFAGSQILITTRISSTEIQIVVPNRSPGTYTIRVENPDGGISETVNFLVQGRPSVSGISVVKGLPGTNVTVSGAHFESGAEIRFKDLLLSAQFLGSGGLSFLVPTVAPELVKLSVRNLTGLESDQTDFEVLAVPTISAVFPASAVAGEQVTVSGAQFKPDIKLYLGDQQVAVVRESTTTLKFEVPAQIAGVFSLRVISDTDNLSSLFVSFTIFRKPQIVDISPTAAQPGSTIKIFGTDLEDPVALIDGSSIPFTYISGALAFVLPQYPPRTILSIRIRNSSNVLSEPVGLMVLAPISLYSAMPSTSAPNTTIELQGAFFPADARVFFGNVEAQVTVVTSDHLSVRVPALPAIPTAIEVRTPAGAVSTTTIPFDVLPTLTVSQVTPNPAPSGTEIVIRGSGFDAGVSVFVRDVQAIDFVRVSDTELKLTVPQLSPGIAQLKIVLPDDRLTLFEFAVPSVWISGISHAVIQVGEWLEITGTGFVQPLAVTVGGIAATEVVIISPTLIKVRVPPFLANTI